MIEQGKQKPRGLTLKRLMDAFSPPSAEKEQTPKGPAPVFPGEILGRDEFFRGLKLKMSRSLSLFFSEPLISTLVDNAEFFSRSRFYPGDFSTAMEILGELLRAQKRLMPMGESKSYIRRRRVVRKLNRI
jgi:hypothetical protein